MGSYNVVNVDDPRSPGKLVAVQFSTGGMDSYTRYYLGDVVHWKIDPHNVGRSECLDGVYDGISRVSDDRFDDWLVVIKDHKIVAVALSSDNDEAHGQLRHTLTQRYGVQPPPRTLWGMDAWLRHHERQAVAREATARGLDLLRQKLREPGIYRVVLTDPNRPPQITQRGVEVRTGAFLYHFHRRVQVCYYYDTEFADVQYARGTCKMIPIDELFNEPHMYVRFTDVHWDLEQDNESNTEESDLPAVFELPVPTACNLVEEGADFLADAMDWCVHGFDFQILTGAKMSATLVVVRDEERWKVIHDFLVELEEGGIVVSPDDAKRLDEKFGDVNWAEKLPSYIEFDFGGMPDVCLDVLRECNLAETAVIEAVANAKEGESSESPGE